jgi:hypothetical protein
MGMSKARSFGLIASLGTAKTVHKENVWLYIDSEQQKEHDVLSGFWLFFLFRRDMCDQKIPRGRRLFCIASRASSVPSI